MATVSEIVFRMVLDAGGINSSSRRVREQLQTTSGRIRTFGEAVDGMGNKMSNVGQNIALPFGAAAAGIGVALGKSIKTAAEFEAQMDRVGAISSASADDMEKLTNQAMELGASTSKSAGEVAIGMENLAASGFEVNEIMGAMPGVIAAAEASGADMAQVADVMAASINAFGLEASDATHVADVLAQAANQSAADITDLQYAFKYAAPTARTLGISMEELAAATGIMADNGIKGEQAGTTLRSALDRLADPPKEAAKQLEALNIQIADSEGNMLPFADIIGEVSEKTSDMANTQKLAALAAIFGGDAVTGMLAVVDAGPDKLRKLTQGLKDSDGASKAASDAMKDNLKGSMEELGGAVETLQIKVGNILIPMFRNLVDWIGKLVDWFNQLSPATQEFIVKAVLISGAVLGLVAVFGILLGILGAALTGIGALIKLLPYLGRAFLFATGPIGLIILAIMGLIAIGVMLYKNWDEVKEAAIILWNLIKDAIVGAAKFVWKWVKKYFQNLADDASMIWDWIKKNAKEKWEQLKSEVVGVASFIREKVTSLFTRMKDGIIETVQNIKRVVTQRFQEVRDAIINPIEKAKDKVKGIVDKITGFFTNMKLKIPTPSLPKLPTFSLKTSSKTIMGKTITYPTGFGIKWAKHGGIFDDPTILGVGEAGREAVVPLVGRQMDPFADAVYKRLQAQINKENEFEGTRTVINNYWTVNADDINDVQKLMSLLNGLVQDVRSR